MEELLSPVLPIGDTGLTPDRTGFATAPLPTNDQLINSAASAGFAPVDLPEVTSATLDRLAIQDPTLRSQTVDPTDKTIAAEKAIDPLLGTSASQTLDNQPAARAKAIDFTPPTISIGLRSDTGASNSDNITRNPTLSGTATDKSKIAQLTLSIDGGASQNIIQNLRRSGKFTLDRDELQRLNGGKNLAEGKHQVTLTATDRFGNTSTTNFDFTLDTIAPLKPGFTIAPTFDTGVLGDLKTTLDRVNLTGATSANSTITLMDENGVSRTTTSNALGFYEFTGLDLKQGGNKFIATAVDAAGNRSRFQRTLFRSDIESGNVVTDWNAATLKAIQAGRTPPPKASYNLALVQTAVFDAVNGIVCKFQAYQSGLPAAAVGANIEAAAAAAAHQILTKLYPTLTGTLDAQLVKSLGRVADGQAETDGVAFGRLVADKLLASRVGDGSDAVVPYTPGTNPGDWQPTSPAFASALLPGWGKVKTFGIETGSQFRPAGPAALTSDEYAKEYNLTKDLGALNSTSRTLDQSEIAVFWADGAGTYTPPGHWNQIAQKESDRCNLSIIDTAKLFASLNVSMADAAISCWDTKYTYNTWRPITAIQKGDTDGNDKTIGDTNWQPLITTPPFPEYTSGHSTFSGAAATVMTDFFGKNYSFKSSSIGLPGIERRYNNFQQAADEAGISRIYGGIHFMSANEDGLSSGRQIGGYVTDKLFKPA